MYKNFITALVFLAVLVTLLTGQIPQKISYQGVLTDSGGVQVPDGNYTLSFSLYGVETGGSALWSESQSVEIINGIFNVNLGEVTILNLPFDQPYWLGVTVDAGTELSPRLELTASGYSLNSMNIVDNSISTDKIVDGSVTQVKLATGISLPPGGTAGGDLTGAYPDPIIADNAVNAANIQDGEVGTGEIADASVTQAKLAPGVSLPPGGIAGGDLTGTYPNPTIANDAVNASKIQDGEVGASEIADASVTQAKLAPGVSLPPGGVAGGDLIGTYPDPTIANNAVNSTKIQDGQVDTPDLANASVTQVKLAPGVSLPPSGTAGGDLAGIYPNPSVSGIQGRLVDSTAPVQGQILKWNGGSWFPADDNIGSSVWVLSGNNIYNTNTDFVGIGTPTPTRKLHLNGSSSDEIAIFRNNRSPGIGLRISLAGLDTPTALMLSTSNASGSTSGASIEFDGTRAGGTRFTSSRISGFLTDPTNGQNGALTFHTRGDGVIGEKMRINEWGNVGIGTTNPENGKLEVIGGSNTGIYTSSTALNAINANCTAGGGYAAGYFTAQNLGTYGVWAQSSDYDALYAWTSAPGHAALRAVGDYAGIFDGDVGIGTGSPVSRLHIAYPSGVGNGLTIQNLSDSDMWEIYVYSTNDFTFFYNGALKGSIDDVSGNYIPSSDAKLKKNIEYLDNELDKIMQMKPAKYHFNEQESNDQRKYYGLVAQDVQKVFPELAVYFDEADQYGVSYTELIPLLIAGMQQQQKQIEHLQNQLNELYNK